MPRTLTTAYDIPPRTTSPSAPAPPKIARLARQVGVSALKIRTIARQLR
ncbi:hypothetical protein ACFQZ4_40000 [Catellatospora coxensis]